MGSNDNTYDDRTYYRRTNNEKAYIKKQVQEAIEEEIMAHKNKEFVTPMASRWSIVPDVYLGEPEQWEFMTNQGEWNNPARGQKFYDGISSVLELPREEKDEYRYFIGWLHGAEILSIRRIKKKSTDNNNYTNEEEKR